MFSNAFIDDPLGHAYNQGWHFIFGQAGWVVTAVALPGWGEFLPIVIGIAYFLGIEWAWQRLKLFWDSVEDSCHVTFGAAVMAALHHSAAQAALWVLLAWAVILAFGMWRRI